MIVTSNVNFDDASRPTDADETATDDAAAWAGTATTTTSTTATTKAATARWSSRMAGRPRLPLRCSAVRRLQPAEVALAVRSRSATLHRPFADAGKQNPKNALKLSAMWSFPVCLRPTASPSFYPKRGVPSSERFARRLAASSNSSQTQMSYRSRLPSNPLPGSDRGDGFALPS